MMTEAEPPQESPTFPTSSCWDPRVDRIYQNESPSKTPASVRISLYDRDPSNINEIVRVQFEDLFTEPEGSHSIDGVWRASYRVFTGTKHWCYRILSAIFAVPCAFCWGLHFACLTFSHIWTIQPSLRSCNIEIYPMARLWGLFVRSFCDPFCESVGLMLSKIKISINKNKE
ncbi:caveolin-3-like [Mytilus trossulus]|uniref:caveolin-3-like n=1 Tax=Mytilus trossulus TaxID=6551 RepID=UPI0030049E94